MLVRLFQCDVGPCVVPSRTEVAPHFREEGDPYLMRQESLGPFGSAPDRLVCVTGARLDARKFFWRIEVLAQSFAKLQPSSPRSRLNRRQTQSQRFCRLLQ